MNHHLDAHNRYLAEVFPDEPLCERILYLDKETRSEVDLKKVGAWEYAAHPSTEVMCASYAIDDGPINRWLETDFLSLLESVPEITDPTTLLCFHNAEFEAAIFEHVFNYRIPTHRIIDSAAVSRHANLPGALEPLGAFFGFDKDMDGNRVMLKLSKPRRPSKANPDRFWRPETKPEDFETTYRYCDRDVEVSRHAMTQMPPLSTFESQVYAATFDMNRRGVRIDRQSAQIMKDVADTEKDRLSREIERDFGFTLGQVSNIADYLELDSVAKAPLRDFLKDETISEPKRRVATARQTFAKTSLNKLPAFIGRSALDGRARGNLIYGGAERTVRWSGAGIQMQNLTRGIGQLQDIAFEALHAGLFEYLYDDEIIDILSGMLRGLIEEIGGLFVGDYAQIEARMLAWLAGDEDLLDQFRRGLDPYRIMASKIYRKAVEDVTGSERFMGKQAVLGCWENDTLVLTDMGWVRITDVTEIHKVWDGIEWVSNKGACYFGRKKTIRSHGVAGTPNHRVWTGVSWAEWSVVQTKTPVFLSALDSATLPSSDTNAKESKVSPGVGIRFAGADFAETKPYPFHTTSRKVEPHAAINAQKRHLRRLERDTGGMPTSFQTMNIERDFLTESRQYTNDVRTRKHGTITTMEAVGFQSDSRIEKSSYGTSSLLMDGTNRTSSWTELKTTETTSLEIFGSQRDQKTRPTNDRSLTFKRKSQNLKPVYDIAHAGPRNRYMILTDHGPMIVHNSGYGLGHRGFQTMLDQTYDVQIETTEAKSVTEAYRKNAPKIVALWKRIERAMLAARGQVGKIIKVNDKIGITFPKLDEMHIILPSKRRLRYYQVKLSMKENGFTQWTCFGKLKTGAGYGRVSIYGGALTGHITQSAARDVMASAIVRLWRKGYPLVLTVHDEIVSLAHGAFQAFCDEMEVTPDWLTDFPLKVDAFETRRYRK